MSVLSPQVIDIDGLNPVFVAAAVAGDSCPPGDRVFARIKNTGGTPVTVTLVVPGTEYTIARPDVPITIPATTGDILFGPLEPAYADPVTGNVGWTYSTNASVTVAALTI